MGKLLVEYNGKLRPVKIEILRQLLSRGYVTLDTRLFVDGQEGYVRDIAEELYEATKSNAPAQSFSESPESQDNSTSRLIRSSLEERTRGTIPIPSRVPKPMSIPTDNNNDGVMIDLDDLVGTSDNIVEKDSKSSGKKWVIISCVIILITAVGFGAFFVLPKFVGSKLETSNATDIQNNETKTSSEQNKEVKDTETIVAEAEKKQREAEKDFLDARERSKRVQRQGLLADIARQADDQTKLAIAEATNDDARSKLEDHTENIEESQTESREFDEQQTKNIDQINAKESAEETDCTDYEDQDSTDDATLDSESNVQESRKEEELETRNQNKFDIAEKEEDKNEYDNEPFDDSINEISQGFQGCDIEQLYRELDKLWSIKKDKYESSKEFEKRNIEFEKDNRDKNILGTITSSSRVAAMFCLFEKNDITYDADSETLTVSLPVFLLDTFDHRKYYEIDAYYEDLGTYIAENNYGVEKEVKKWRNTSYGVVDGSEIKRDIIENIVFEIEPEKARYLEGNIASILVFTIDLHKKDHAYIATEIGLLYHKPTLDKPSDWSSLKRVICGKDMEIWLYNQKTGEILYKRSAYKEDLRNSAKTKNHNTRNRPKKVKDNKDDQITIDSEVPAPKTWEELLSESVDEPANWEKKKPTLTVPGDAATLAEAIEKANSGDVIQLKQSSSAYSLGVKLGAARKGVVIDKPLAIVGETGEASEVTIEVGVDESIFVETKGAMFKGITFQCGALGLAKTCEPIVSVGKSGYATFKYCSFVGNGVERSIGVETSGKGAKSAFWKCDFKHFGDSGLLAKDEAVATLRYCEFLDDNHYAFTSEGGASVTLARCHFVDNEICIHAETGGSCEITESRFAGNKRRADISPASRNRVKESENVYDE